MQTKKQNNIGLIRVEITQNQALFSPGTNESINRSTSNHVHRTKTFCFQQTLFISFFIVCSMFYIWSVCNLDRILLHLMDVYGLSLTELSYQNVMETNKVIHNQHKYSKSLGLSVCCG